MDVKKERVFVRLSKTEKTEWLNKAKKEKKPLSKWIRSQCNDN